MTRLHDYVCKLPESEQKAIAAHTEQLIAEERARISLTCLRESFSLSQVALAKLMDVGQGTISKYENAKYLSIDTVREYLEALGCELRLVAKLPDGTVKELKL